MLRGGNTRVTLSSQRKRKKSELNCLERGGWPPAAVTVGTWSVRLVVREIQERGTAPIVFSPPALSLHSYLQSIAASFILSGLLEERFIFLSSLIFVSIYNSLANQLDFMTFRK